MYLRLNSGPVTVRSHAHTQLVREVHFDQLRHALPQNLFDLGEKLP